MLINDRFRQPLARTEHGPRRGFLPYVYDVYDVSDVYDRAAVAPRLFWPQILNLLGLRPSTTSSTTLSTSTTTKTLFELLTATKSCIPEDNFFTNVFVNSTSTQACVPEPEKQSGILDPLSTFVLSETAPSGVAAYVPRPCDHRPMKTVDWMIFENDSGWRRASGRRWNGTTPDSIRRWKTRPQTTPEDRVERVGLVRWSRRRWWRPTRRRRPSTLSHWSKILISYASQLPISFANSRAIFFSIASILDLTHCRQTNIQINGWIESFQCGGHR